MQRLPFLVWTLLALGGWLSGATVAETADLAGLHQEFLHPPGDSRIIMRWWWFGPAVTNSEIERELGAMKQAGIGGVEIQPVYPLALDDPEHDFLNFPYLSDRFIAALRFAVTRARQLGLRCDITLGSGWPFGGPHILLTQAAGQLRVAKSLVGAGDESVLVPDVVAGEKILAAFVKETAEKSLGQMLDLSQIAKGRLTFPTGNRPRTIIWFIASRTGMMVKRPAIGAEGFVLDHFDQAAIRKHLETVGNLLLEAFGPEPPYAVFSDSLEVYGSDWTGDLLEEFRRRRGYDLTPYLPALVEDIGPQTSDIRHDWGKTLTELIDERYLTPIRDWASQHGTRFRSQTYGIPAVSLASNQYVDLPEGEGDQWRGFSPARWASSASHQENRSVTSAETWTWLHSPPFRATPLDMKADADRFFLEGVNQIVGHGWPYSPPGVPEPGWSFYAAGAFNEHNPWWLVMPELALYLERISYLLRQGQPIADVALLVPTDDAWASFIPGKDSLSETVEQLYGADIIPQILNSGSNFDFIDADTIDKLGIPYPVLVLPHTERLPLGTYRRVERYAQMGGVVIATGRLPTKAPGLREAVDAAAVAHISERLFRAPQAKAWFVSDDGQLGAMLAKHFTPDITASPKVPALGFVHRRLPFAEIYFLVNTSNRSISTRLRFHSQAEHATWWDPFSGQSTPVSSDHGIRLELDAYESRILVLGKEAPAEVWRNAKPARNGQLATIDLGTDWNVTFSGLNKTIVMPRFRSWTEDPATRFYSGKAVYERQFSLPQDSDQASLDFGPGREIEASDQHSRFLAGLESPIREVCLVFVDDRRAGSIWKPPYRVELPGKLAKGEHRLRIEVYNTAINELAGRALPDYRLLNSRYGQRFIPQDTEKLEPLPSGLLGTPRLVIER